MINENYEKLDKAIDLLGNHRYEVCHSLDRKELPSLTKAMKLLIEIRNDERKREQDEHAIAFAKLHKDSEDPTTRRLSRDILDKAGEEE